MNQPYTYLIGWSKVDRWYYGRRTAKNCDPAEIWKTYFTSSKEVKSFRKLVGEPDIIEIRQLFNNVETCKLWEEKVLKRLRVSKNERWLNVREGDHKWDTTGKYSGGTTGYYHSEETKLKMRKPKNRISKIERKGYRTNKSSGIWVTPLGEFKFTTDAAKAHNISNVAVFGNCKRNRTGWKYIPN